MDWIGNHLDTILGVLLIAVVAWLLRLYLSPSRRRLESHALRMTKDHGLILQVYSTPGEMDGLTPKDMLGVEPAWLADLDFYFSEGIPGDGPPSIAEWPDWAAERGGEHVGWRHILILIQATQERTVVVKKPRLTVSRREPVAGGLVLSPTKELGGNGLMVRQFEVDLSVSPPTVQYHSEGGETMPIFRMNKGDTEAFLVIAHATKDRVEWSLTLPVVVDGEPFDLGADNNGRPFVSVGPEGLEGLEGRWWHSDSRTWGPASW